MFAEHFCARLVQEVVAVIRRGGGERHPKGVRSGNVTALMPICSLVLSLSFTLC